MTPREQYIREGQARRLAEQVEAEARRLKVAVWCRMIPEAGKNLALVRGHLEELGRDIVALGGGVE